MTMTLPGPTDVNLRPKISMEKTCSVCKETKPLSEFHRRKITADGYNGRCAVCARASTYAWRDAHPEATKRSMEKHRASDQFRTYQREFKQRQVLAKFGMTQEDYDSMIAAQGGTCAICRATSADSVGRRLHIDHNHQTGEVRGLLCGNCNLGIGKFGDNPDRMVKAVQYLNGELK
jgi:hypothetical protein